MKTEQRYDTARTVKYRSGLHMIALSSPVDRRLLRLAQDARSPAAAPDVNASYEDVIVRKPWGHEYLLFETPTVAAWILHIDQGRATSMHCHENKLTTLAVLAGGIECETLHESLPREAGECAIFAPSTFHRSTGISKETAIVLELETPPDKQDLVRIVDTYGRSGLGYENRLHQYSSPGISLKIQDDIGVHKKKIGKFVLHVCKLELPASWALIESLEDQCQIFLDLQDAGINPQNSWQSLGAFKRNRRLMQPDSLAVILVPDDLDREFRDDMQVRLMTDLYITSYCDE